MMASGVFVGAGDIVGRIAFAGALSEAVDQPFDFIEAEQQRWKPVIARAKIRPD